MKTYYGNYLGLVVDHRDPEERGRCKVFIPHIMPALYYEDEEGAFKDIKFNITGAVEDGESPGGLTKEVLDKLQKILPWAECASPIFGSSPAAALNYATGKSSTTIPNLGKRVHGQSTELQSTLNSANEVARAEAAVESGLLCTVGKCANGANNILSYYTTGVGWAKNPANSKGTIASHADANNMGPVLEERYSMTKVTDTGQYRNGDTRVLSGGRYGHIETYMNGKWYSDHAQSGSLEGALVSSRNEGDGVSMRYRTLGLYRLPTITKTASSKDLDSPLTDEQGAAEFGVVEPDLPEEDQNPSALGQTLAQSQVRDTQEETKNEEESPGIVDDSAAEITELNEINKFYIDESKGEMLHIDGVTVLNTNDGTTIATLSKKGDGEELDEDGNSTGRFRTKKETAATDSSSQESADTEYASEGGANRHPSEYATEFGPDTNYVPKGFFGGAKAGQMVWVFFQEGDPLFPVYFAASYGAKEWANINEHTGKNPKQFWKAPDNEEEDDYPGTDNVYMGAGGGFRDGQIISGQKSGFEKDEFAFEVFGKTGSCLRFTFHATLLNSRYDFRQHTQGDAHYITGGNRTDRTIGDHVIICEQDQITTIGNWSKEALEASNNIQKVLDRAMKAAKDTYEK